MGEALTPQYLRIKNWDRYQNADIFKKSHGRPPWCKLLSKRDLHLDQESVEVRLLFLELLKVACEYGNVMSNDSEWIARETRMSPKAVAKALPVLIKGAWLSETRSSRRSRKILENISPSLSPREDKRREEKETSKAFVLLDIPEQINRSLKEAS